VITGTSAAFTAQVEGVEQVATWRMQMTLPVAAAAYDDVTLAVEKLSIDASTTSDMPENARLQVGYPAMSCSFTLSGLVDVTDESKTAAWLFDPYSTSSPLYQSDALQAAVTVDFGLYTDNAAGTATQGTPEFVRKFTGFVDDYTVSEDGTVVFTCVDSRTLLRSSPTIPPVVTAPPYNAGLTSEYAIDALLRKASRGSISSWPAARANCVLAAGMRASLWPEVGALVTTATQPVPQFAAGLYGSGLTQAFTAAGGLGAITYQMSSAIGTTLFIEFWVTGVFFPPGVGILDLAGVGSGLSFLTCQAATTGPQIIVASGLGGPNFTPSIPIDSNPHYVSFQITLPAAGGTAWSATVAVDGVTASSGTLNFVTPRGATAWQYATVGAGIGTGTIQGVQVTTESAPTSNTGFVPQAVLDPSLNPLQVVPEMSGDPWQAIQQIADAEFAVAGFDESAMFRFTNRNTIRGLPLARTVTSTTSLRALGIESTAASVINRAMLPYTPYAFGVTPSTIFTLDTPTRVPRGATITLAATVDSLFANLDASISKLPNGSADTSHSFYRASTTRAGLTEHPGITFGSIIQTSSNELAITITNPTGLDAWLVSPAVYTDVPVGTPLLRLAALAVTPGNALLGDFQYPPVAADGSGGASTTRWREVAYQPSANPWLQDPDAALQLAMDVVVDSCVPRPNLTGVSIVPDPRLQLTDVVRVQDPDLTGVDEYARVFAWTLTYESGSEGGGMTYDMTIDARALSAPGGWITGYAGRSEIGSTAYVYPAT
jgi:hypothetical protein